MYDYAAHFLHSNLASTYLFVPTTNTILRIEDSDLEYTGYATNIEKGTSTTNNSEQLHFAYLRHSIRHELLDSDMLISDCGKHKT